jgi:vancomycin resistance protein YoaR
MVRIFLALISGAIFFMIIAALTFLGFQVWYAGRIYPGVSVAALDLSGMQMDEATAEIIQKLDYSSQGNILLVDDDQSWMISPAEVGVYLDAETTARNAFSIGRQGFLKGLDEQFHALYYGFELQTSLIFDQAQAYQYLASLSGQIDLPLIEAQLLIEGTDVIVRPGQDGRTLDITESLKLLTNQISTLQDGIVELEVLESPAKMIDVTEQAELARRILSEPLVLTILENEPSGTDQIGPWKFEPLTLSTMLSFERVTLDSGETYQVTVNAESLRSFLIEQSAKLASRSVNSRFIFNDDTHLLELIQPALIGRRLDIDASIEAIQQKVILGEHTIPLELILISPAVTDDMPGEDLGITELVHAETSYFYGSSTSRLQNITAAASRFHGLLIAPGETFSMAEALGDISLDNGYAEAWIIYGNQTIKGVGGGVCQVSTTLFRNTFFAGFPIVERHPHAYRVYYYEKAAGNIVNTDLAGLDATVYVPIVDFKFTNDTPHWLLMETYVSPSYSSLTWKFYSTSDGRTVDWETTGPENIVDEPDPDYRENPDLDKGEIKQVDWGVDGADVTVERTVFLNDQIYLQDTFFTRYKPWRDIYEYGPGTEDMPPESEDNGGE